MAQYIIRDPRTRMFLAKNEKKNPRLGMTAGFGQDYKWVRTHNEATAFSNYSDAELPPIFLNLAAADICPLVEGTLGDPITRNEAMANGTFHSVRAQ